MWSLRLCKECHEGTFQVQRANHIGFSAMVSSKCLIQPDHGQRASSPDQATGEKNVLCCGNVTGVTGVNDLITAAQPANESRWYTVVKGDNLSKIAKEHFGNASDYPNVLEANSPMLSHPYKIYPGQLLRIP